MAGALSLLEPKINFTTHQQSAEEDVYLENVTAQDIRWAKEAGFLKPLTLVGKAITAVGEYQKRVVMKDLSIGPDGQPREKATSLSAEKLELFNYAQKALESLSSLEREINSGKDESRIIKNSTPNSEDNEFQKYLCKAHQKNAEDQPSLKEYLRLQTLAILAWLSQANRELVGKKGNFMWGDFNNFIEDAIQSTKDYQFPLSVQPTAQHDLRPDSTDEAQLYTLKLNDYLGSKAHDQNELRSLLRYLRYKRLERSRQLTPLDPLPRWKSGKWNILMGLRRLRDVDQEWNTWSLKKILLPPFVTLFDNLFGFFVGLMGNKPFLWLQKKYQALIATNVENHSMRGVQAEQEILNHSIKPSIGNKVGRLIHTGAQHFGASLLSIGEGLWNIGKHFVTEIKLNTKETTESDFNSIMESIQSKTVAVETKNPVGPASAAASSTSASQAARASMDAGSKDSDERTSSIDENTQTLQLTTPLDPYESNDLLGLGVSGTKGFIDLFAHNIYAKHPTLGLLFTVSYGMGLLPLIAPKLASHLLSSHYVSFIQTIKETTDQGSSVLAKAGVSFLVAKLQTAGVELVSDGINSWTIKGLDKFRRDPAMISLMIGVAYLLGHFYVDGTIQGHSAPGAHTLAEEKGSFAPFTETFIGAKLFAMVFGMLANTEQAHEKAQELNQTASKVSKDLHSLLQNWSALPKLPAYKKALISDHIGAAYGYNSELARLVRAKCKENEKDSYAAKSIKHLFAYLAVSVRIPVALISGLIRWCFLPAKIAFQSLRRTGAELKDLLVDSYARVSTALFGLSSLIGNMIVQRAPRVFAGIAHRFRTIGSAILTWIRESSWIRSTGLNLAPSEIDQKKIASFAKRSLNLHRIGEQSSYGVKEALGVHEAQRQSQSATHFSLAFAVAAKAMQSDVSVIDWDSTRQPH